MTIYIPCDTLLRSGHHNCGLFSPPGKPPLALDLGPSTVFVTRRRPQTPRMPGLCWVLAAAPQRLKTGPVTETCNRGVICGAHSFPVQPCSLRCSAKTRDDRGATPHETPGSSCRHIFGSVSTDHFQTTRTCMLFVHFSPHLERTWLLHRQLPLWSGAGAWRRASCDATHCQITKYHIAVSCTDHTPYICVKFCTPYKGVEELGYWLRVVARHYQPSAGPSVQKRHVPPQKRTV